VDWKILTTTFVAIFVAELGDKTQLATLSFASGAPSRWAVFAGASLALVATSALAVIGGEALGRLIPPAVLRRGAGVLFIILGVVFLLSRSEAGG